MLTVNAASSNTAESVRECDFYDLACETGDYSRKLYPKFPVVSGNYI